MLAAAIVLAAGASRRMGMPKALLPTGGVPLVRRHVEALVRVVPRVLVVVGPDAEAVALALEPTPAELLRNPGAPRQAMLGSVQLAERHAPAGDLLLTPVDVPPASPALLAALAAASGSRVPHGPDGDGHPVRLGAAQRPAVHLAPAQGLRTVLEGAPRLPWPDPVGRDFDTPEAWNAWRRGG